MKSRILFLVKSYIFWIGLFIISKFIFLAYQFPLTNETPFLLWMNSICHGLVMDMSMASYVMILFCAIMAFTFFVSEKRLALIFKIVNTTFLATFILCIVIDLEIYRNWGYHLDATPLQYLKTPKLAAASTPLSIYLLMTAIYAIMLFFSIKFFDKYILKQLKNAPRYPFYYLIVFLLISGSLIIPARGGLSPQTMNASFVYFSENIYANHIAMNPVWNFLYAVDHIDNFDRSYDCLSDAEVEKEFELMMQDNGITPSYLKTNRPNVILIILESFTADLLTLPDVAPNLKKLTQEGLHFDKIYANAGRSDKGLSAVLGAYPAHPGDAIIKYTNKIEKMPSIGSAFKKMGYENHFYHGGYINFANINSFLSINCYDKITSQEDFPKECFGAKWGVHDHYIFERFFYDIEKQEAPFFYTLFTLSSHEPFDVPETIITNKGKRNKQLNSCAYTDKHLGLFIEKLKASPQWDNSLVVLIADHSCRYVFNHVESHKERYHIPMIWTGGALKQTGTISKYGSQTDLTATVLAQMEQAHDEFIFSKNLLSSDVKGFSYYTYSDGCGYIDDNCYQVYDNSGQKILINEGSSPHKIPGRIYLQKSYNYFLEK